MTNVIASGMSLLGIKIAERSRAGDKEKRKKGGFSTPYK
jgi:hypothetical protein